MKKLLSKVTRKKPIDDTPPSRITNDTVAEHREQILSGAKRFKYPLQYARHKLVINTVIISIATIVALLFVGWMSLYVFQTTSDFMYRVTRVIDVPAGYVDGAKISYSDYLMRYRSSIYYLEKKEQVSLTSDEGKIQQALIQNRALDDAIADAYARKLADEMNITVSDEELEAFLKLQRQSSDGEVSTQTYDAVVLDYYNWTPDEYRDATKSRLLRQKVAYAVDTDALATAERVGARLGESDDLQAIAKELGESVTYGASGLVPNANQDGGLAQAAAAQDKGVVSSMITSTTGDGYYYVRTLEKTDSQVKYDYIFVPVSAFDDQLEQKKSSDDTLKLYIDRKEV